MECLWKKISVPLRQSLDHLEQKGKTLFNF